jgi:hypothetical protein
MKSIRRKETQRKYLDKKGKISVDVTCSVSPSTSRQILCRYDSSRCATECNNCILSRQFGGDRALCWPINLLIGAQHLHV